jgi:hypothetical protein
MDADILAEVLGAGALDRADYAMDAGLAEPIPLDRDL